MKRVALVGNLNNSFSAIMKWLRSRGYDAHLFYRPFPHYFHVKADTFDLAYLDYCHEIDWLDRGFRPANIDVKGIRELFSSFDKIIAQGDEASVINFCSIPIDIYFPYGTDISKYVFLPHQFSVWEKIRLFTRKNSGFSFSDLNNGTSSKYLHQAIKTAKNVFLDVSNPEFEGMLHKIGLEGEFRHVPMPFIYYPEYEKVFAVNTSPSVHWRDAVDELRRSNDLLVLYHGRQIWVNRESKFAPKENDVLIRGFGEFIKKSKGGVKAHLIMLEFGPDVQFSKELIKELQIEENVTWLPQMYRKDVMYLISQIDIGSGEFGRSYLTFGTIIENMVLGKPVIHFRDDELYKDAYPWLYPLINSKDPQEISEKLIYYSTHKQELEKMGSEAQRWVKELFILKPLQQIEEVLNG